MLHQVQQVVSEDISGGGGAMSSYTFTPKFCNLALIWPQKHKRILRLSWVKSLHSNQSLLWTVEAFQIDSSTLLITGWAICERTLARDHCIIRTTSDHKSSCFCLALQYIMIWMTVNTHQHIWLEICIPVTCLDHWVNKHAVHSITILTRTTETPVHLSKAKLKDELNVACSEKFRSSQHLLMQYVL